MADISSLGNLAVAEPLELASYKINQEFRLPKAGKYTVRAPEFSDASFGATRAGFLSASIDPTIVGGDYDGFTIKFTKVSAKTWRNKDGINESQMGRYLRACGITDTVGGTPQELANAIERTSGQLWTAVVDWRAYNKNTGFTVEGMENFPTDGNGGHLPYTIDPNDLDENGDPVRLRANLFVSRYLPVR